jgi:hypothetical protein
MPLPEMIRTNDEMAKTFGRPACIRALLVSFIRRPQNTQGLETRERHPKSFGTEQ